MASTARSIETFGDDITVCICTFNSADTLQVCLASIQRGLSSSRLVVVDHDSSDGSVKLAKAFGCDIFTEKVGLGRARQLCFDVTRSMYIAFVDSDAQILRPDFFHQAIRLLRDPSVGAIVGMAIGHKMAYGLPASLLVLRKRDFEGRIIPDEIDARETYYIQHRLSSLNLRTVYLADTIVHTSRYRKRKAEWEGANTRIAAGISARELSFCFKVMVLMSINSRSVRNLAYVPILYLKFLSGFVEPEKWRRLERTID